MEFTCKVENWPVLSHGFVSINFESFLGNIKPFHIRTIQGVHLRSYAVFLTAAVLYLFHIEPLN